MEKHPIYGRRIETVFLSELFELNFPYSMNYRCIFYFGKDTNGNPDMTTLKTLLYTPEPDDPMLEREGQYV
jgi:hypothetical protein